MLLHPDLRLYLLPNCTKDLEGMLSKLTDDTMHGRIADTMNEVLGCKIVPCQC